VDLEFKKDYLIKMTRKKVYILITEVAEIYNKGKTAEMQLFSENLPRFPKGDTFSLACEMRHAIILRSKKNSVKIQTNSVCYLPQLPSVSSRRKQKLGIPPVCNPKERNKYSPRVMKGGVEQKLSNAIKLPRFEKPSWLH